MHKLRKRWVWPVAALGLALSGCGSSDPTKNFTTEGLIIPASACMIEPSSVGEAVKIDDIDGPSACGVQNAWRVTSLHNVRFSQPATVTCGLVAPVDDWIRRSVQPAAQKIYGEPVATIVIAGSYTCRARNAKAGSKMSEHGFGNALDISAFILANGRKITVKDGWNGWSGNDRDFLRQVRGEACGTFSTVLGPGNAYHDDHLHVDMQVRRTAISCRT